MAEFYVAGVDAGSTYTKSAVLDDGGNLVATAVLMTGVKITEAARKAYDEVLRKAGIKENEVKFLVGTGYGRYNITFGNIQVTEISCHAKGAHYLFPNTRTVLDMGGQDTKAIRINERGEVVDFCMNDKCAAGTGRFIEGAAKVLGLSLKEVGEESSEDIKYLRRFCRNRNDGTACVGQQHRGRSLRCPHLDGGKVHRTA